MTICVVVVVFRAGSSPPPALIEPSELLAIDGGMFLFVKTHISKMHSINGP